MTTDPQGAAVVIGSRIGAVMRMERVLKFFFEDVIHFSEFKQAAGCKDNRWVRLVVIMDRDRSQADPAEFLKIRQKFPAAKMAGVSDAFQPDQEVLLRAAGTVFIGSYERFVRHAGEILSQVLKRTQPAAAGR